MQSEVVSWEIVSAEFKCLLCYNTVSTMGRSLVCPHSQCMRHDLSICTWAIMWMTGPWLLLPLSHEPKTNTEVHCRSWSADYTVNTSTLKHTSQAVFFFFSQLYLMIECNSIDLINKQWSSLLQMPCVFKYGSLLFISSPNSTIMLLLSFL